VLASDPNISATTISASSASMMSVLSDTKAVPLYGFYLWLLGLVQC
jgi:hypothetical protein